MNQSKYEKVEYYQDTQAINIQIKDPQIDAAGGFTTYLIIGTDKIGSFETRRRFNDFYFVREGLIKTWPGCYIPPIPRKKTTGNKQDKFVESRRRFLEYFLVKVAGIKCLYYCEIFQQFLRNKSVQLEPMVEMISNQPTTELVKVYKELFGNIQMNEPLGELRTKASNFYGYLKRSEKELEQLKEVAKELSDAQQNFNNNLNVLNTIFLPEYEKSVFTEYVNDQLSSLVFLNDNDINEKVRELRDFTTVNPYEYLVDLVRFELREVVAMQEAIETRDQYEHKKKKLEEKHTSQQSELSKLMSGKTTFKSIFTRGSKDDQIKIIKNEIEVDGKEIEALTLIIDLITLLLAREINNFRSYKQVHYLQIVSKVAALEKKHLGIYGGQLEAVVKALASIQYD